MPAEDPESGPGVLGKFELCLYTTRDAANVWQESLSTQLESCGFSRGLGHTTVCWQPTKLTMKLVHGHDYVSSGMQDEHD